MPQAGRTPPHSAAEVPPVQEQGIRKGVVVDRPALVPSACQPTGQCQYLFLRAVGTVGAVLKEVHELRPSLQAFLSKNGG